MLTYVYFQAQKHVSIIQLECWKGDTLSSVKRIRCRKFFFLSPKCSCAKNEHPVSSGKGGYRSSSGKEDLNPLILCKLPDHNGSLDTCLQFHLCKSEERKGVGKLLPKGIGFGVHHHYYIHPLLQPSSPVTLSSAPHRHIPPLFYLSPYPPLFLTGLVSMAGGVTSNEESRKVSAFLLASW